MTIQQKNKLLVLGFVAILVIGYFLSISETFSLKRNYDQLKENERIFENIPKRLKVLTQKEVYYDSLLSSNQITETSLQNNLLKTVTLRNPGEESLRKLKRIRLFWHFQMKQKTVLIIFIF